MPEDANDPRVTRPEKKRSTLRPVLGWVPVVRLDTFLRRRKRFLPIVGAGIVLVTFVVKEAVRDHFKDLVTSIDGAEGIFLVREDKGLLTNPLRKLNRQMDSVQITLQSRGPQYEPDDAVEDKSYGRMELIAEDHHTLMVSIENVSRLLEEIRAEASARKRVEKLKKDIDDAFEPYQANISRLVVEEEDAAENKGDDKLAHDILQTIAKAVQEMESKTIMISGQCDALATEVFKKAENTRKRDEIFLNIFTWCSYALYALGWGLGLLGKLYGVEGVVEGI